MAQSADVRRDPTPAPAVCAWRALSPPNWAFATKINKPLRHAGALSKQPGVSCQSSLHFDIFVEMRRTLFEGGRSWQAAKINKRARPAVILPK